VPRQARLIVPIILVVLVLLVALFILTGEALTAEPPEPEPASADVVRAALKQQRAARRAHEALSRVRSCFGDSAPVRVGKTPERAATAQEWEKARAHWRHQAKDWQAKVKAGRAKMRNPGGSGAARWWPAALYCGWKPPLKSWFCAIVWRESSARPLAVNASSGCFGLLQLHPMHWSQHGSAWIRDVFHQLRLGWKLYRECGPAPWAL